MYTTLVEEREIESAGIVLSHFDDKFIKMLDSNDTPTIFYGLTPAPRTCKSSQARIHLLMLLEDRAMKLCDIL